MSGKIRNERKKRRRKTRKSQRNTNTKKYTL